MFRPRRPMRLESLETRQMLSVTIMEQENNDSTSRANSFSLAEDGLAQLIGTVSTGDDRDYFRFTPGGDSTTQLTFSITSPAGLRPDFEIQNAAGDTLAETDPDHGINSGSLVVALGATYYIRLDGINSYQVNLSLPPVVHAVADLAIALEDGAPVTINVLANDIGSSPTDGKSLVSVDGSGMHGTVSIGPGGAGVIYTAGTIPNLEAGQTAAETFRYTMSYAGGTRQATAVVTVNVAGANHAPSATDDSWTASEDSGVIVIPVLDNDMDIDFGDTKRVVAVQSNSAAGVVQIAANGSGILFYPNGAYQTMLSGQSIVEHLTYTMADRAGALSTASVVLTVAGANDPPHAVSNSATVSEDDGFVFLDVLPDDTDVDIDDLQSVVSVDGSATPGGYYFVCVCAGGACVPYWIPGMPAIRGAISVAPNGHGVLYSPGSAFQSLRTDETAIEVFRYTMRDRDGMEATANVIVTVTGRNERVLTLQTKIDALPSETYARTLPPNTPRQATNNAKVATTVTLDAALESLQRLYSSPHVIPRPSMPPLSLSPLHVIRNDGPSESPGTLPRSSALLFESLFADDKDF